MAGLATYWPLANNPPQLALGIRVSGRLERFTPSLRVVFTTPRVSKPCVTNTMSQLTRCWPETWPWLWGRFQVPLQSCMATVPALLCAREADLGDCVHLWEVDRRPAQGD